MNLELYYYEQCPFCQRVLQTIKQLGLEDKVILKNTLTNAENAQFHSQKTGRSTVPCLYIEGEPMFESADIVQWLNTNKDKL